MKTQWKQLIPYILIPLAVGGLAAFLTMDSMETFSSLNQPPLSPPAWLFPVVWTILYILMGIASYLALGEDIMDAPAGSISSGEPGTSDAALKVYAAQLVFNFGWSLIFFNLGAYLLAFVWLVILWVLILITMVLFSQRSRTAALLLVPYLLWVSFAGYLNLGIWWLN